MNVGEWLERMHMRRDAWVVLLDRHTCQCFHEFWHRLWTIAYGEIGLVGAKRRLEGFPFLML